MLLRRIPGSIGARPAREFVRANTEHLVASTGLGLGANDPCFVVLWTRRDAITSAMGIFSLGVSGGSLNNSRRLQSVTGDAVQAVSTDGTPTTSNANSSANTFVTGGPWYAIVAAWAAANDRKVYLDGVQVATGSATRTLTVAPNEIIVGSTPAGVAYSGGVAHVAVFAGVVSDALLALHASGVHPTQLPGTLLECWDLDRVGPLVGLVRGTVLSPVNGGSLTPGPARVQGPPRRSFLYVGGAAAGGATTYTLTANAGTATATGQDATPRTIRTVLADAATATISGVSATPRVIRTVLADAATATISGVSATPRVIRTVLADAATATISGVSAAVQWVSRLVADAGSAALTGIAAGLLWLRQVVGLEGSVDITGEAATVRVTRTVTADPGTITLAGQSANLTVPGTGPDTEARKKQFLLLGVMKALLLSFLSR